MAGARNKDGMGGGGDSVLIGVTTKKEANPSEWYLEVIKKAELLDYSKSRDVSSTTQQHGRYGRAFKRSSVHVSKPWV